MPHKLIKTLKQINFFDATTGGDVEIVPSQPVVLRDCPSAASGNEVPAPKETLTLHTFYPKSFAVITRSGLADLEQSGAIEYRSDTELRLLLTDLK